MTPSAVLEDPPCAVAVAPVGYAARPRAVHTVGVGYDGSVAGEDALAAARELATAHGAGLSALEAVRPHVLARGPRDPAEIDARVQAARRRISALGGVEAHAEYGGAADALERFGADVDLLVIGAHHYGDGQDLAPPSLAQHVAGRAPCALLVLPIRHAAQPTGRVRQADGRRCRTARGRAARRLCGPSRGHASGVYGCLGARRVIAWADGGASARTRPRHTAPAGPVATRTGARRSPLVVRPPVGDAGRRRGGRLRSARERQDGARPVVARGGRPVRSRGVGHGRARRA